MAPRRIRGIVSGLSRNTVLMTAGSLFSDMSTEMLTPILPIFLTQALHANGSIVGLVDGIAQALRNLIDGFSGSISDRFRTRKPIALAGYLLGGLAKPLMGLATAWPGVLAGRLVDRLGAGIRSAPRDALLASSVDDRDRGSGFGLEGFGENAGACLGPLLTLLLLYALQIDMRAVFFVALIPGLLAFAVVAAVKEEKPPIARRAKARSPLRQLPRQYWTYLIAIVLFSLGNSTNAFLILRTQEIGASLVATTLIYAAFNLVAALVSYPLGHASDRWGRKSLLLASFVVFLIVYLGFFLAHSLVVAGVLFMVYGIYQGTFRTLGRALASDLVPEHLQATGIGWYGATVGLFQLAASLVAGVLWDTLGHESVFLYGVASAAAGIAGLIWLVPPQGRAMTG